MKAEMERSYQKGTRPNLRTKRFSTLHIELLEQILASGKTNQQLNLEYGYTLKSHCLVDHSRKVMYKLLILENLKKEEYQPRVTYPRLYKFWWRNILNKHKKTLLQQAVTPAYYEGSERTVMNEIKQPVPWNYYLT